MPEVSRFYGIIARMQSERGGKHHKPHIHALYSEYEIVIAFDGEVLEGCFPMKQRKILEAWIMIHEDELIENWNLLNSGEGFFKIEPLK